MNPFRRLFVRHDHYRDLRKFVQQWDELEELLINIYKAGAASPAETRAHAEIRSQLRRAYSHWQVQLHEYWKETRAAGEIVKDDPFLQLLAIEQADDFIDDWRGMQTLPAAREALNQLLLESD